MNPTELINPKCKLTGTTPVVRSTKHLFLDLPKLSNDLQAYIDASSQKVRGGGAQAVTVDVADHSC
jgi:methionyl-tRNA synthetase